ncbi:DUF1552 domain-containing protein [Stieleria varia]|uniref:Secreted protein containing DUF1552 n=1 Tax=Stieleria varia TaxID=2528005 RepID=A0A5C6A6C2_9BACT|nr:DUF1552 domain-containing protein [Stieleria varia]TWT94611.1 hypothetical protein Pla52n_54320 [Stieleria varia]
MNRPANSSTQQSESAPSWGEGSQVILRQPIARRQLLRGLGAAAIGLPILEAMSPMLSATAAVHGAEPPSASPNRFIAICATLGFHGPFLFPEQTGRDYELSPYLQQLKEHRDQFTVFSGLSHPDQQGNNGHASEMTWLTGARRPGLAGFRNTISLDQLIASHVGLETRFPYLALGTGGQSLSWTRSGVPIPAESRPSVVFKSLFVQGSETEVADQMRQLRRGRSILDTVSGEAAKLNRELGQRDREKMDQYLSSVRELESRLQQTEGWAQRPKPVVDAQPPKDVTEKTQAIERQRLMYEMIAMALQTDSTRTITYTLSGLNAVPQIAGVSSDWHNLSHHGKDPEKINELKLIEQAEFDCFGEFLTKLHSVREGDQTLLDRTAVLFGSNLGNASSHDWHNLPIILAGGGYRHGQYVAHDEKNNTPLANLHVALAQRMGVPTESFGSSTQVGIRGLDS